MNRRTLFQAVAGFFASLLVPWQFKPELLSVYTNVKYVKVNGVCYKLLEKKHWWKINAEGWCNVTTVKSMEICHECSK